MVQLDSSVVSNSGLNISMLDHTQDREFTLWQ